ncbi:MAG: S-layer homology domain-containing protein, partial [Clostridia bacterium]|nr:S-layer homology domain-containing protein [Clostridia bacterium]
VLYRMENSPAVSAANSFTDVSESDWFASAVAWADSLGIVQGYDGKFDPNAPITREQLATILWRYKGSPSGGAELSGYSDAANLSSWAQAAMQWAVGQKLISGMTATTIVPQGTANRAQMATILTRMMTG